MSDLRFQTFNIMGPGSTPIPVAMGHVDEVDRIATSACISYGCQIGASIVMLLAVLVMNPAAKLRRAYTALQVAALALNVVRTLLLSLFFASQWMTFYAQHTGDFSFVPRGDYNASVASNVVSVLVHILLETCLIAQAWAMVNLWPSLWKWAAAAASALISTVTVGFRFAFCILQTQSILSRTKPNVWVARASVTTAAVSIFWYCVLFNVQLITHLVRNRTFLPRTSGLTPMEALAVSNGILMVVPALFTSLQWMHSIPRFEPGSLVSTSVVIILPLGTLVAHRLAALGSYNISGGSGSGWNHKPSATHESITSSNPRSRLVARVEAPIHGPNYEVIVLHDQSQGLGGSNGVRVYRDFDQTVTHSPRRF